jgi:hypothetical protein
MIAILERLRSLSVASPDPGRLPSGEEVAEAEAALGVSFPPSYTTYLLQYADVEVGHYELYSPAEEDSYLDLVKEVEETWASGELERHLLPFVEDNGDYFCFDLKSAGPEYEVVYWSHNGTTNERWKNFLHWVEACWIGETESEE